MEPNSIVSFNNDSTFQEAVKVDFTEVESLKIALHTTRNRCLLLQRRLSSLENENMKLHLEINDKEGSLINEHVEREDDQLLEKIAELTKQKSQLMHHVFMVTCENKHLWSCLSQFDKGNNRFEFADDTTEQTTLQKKSPRLVRSDTFVHSTPAVAQRINFDDKDVYPEASLEEISLKLINSYLQEKSQLVEQYDQMVELQAIDEDFLHTDSIGFTYFEQGNESLMDIKNQIEKLNMLKKEVAEQESNMKVIIDQLKTVKNCLTTCTCQSKTQRYSSSDEICKSPNEKETEALESLSKWATPVNSVSFNDHLTNLSISHSLSRREANNTMSEQSELEKTEMAKEMDCDPAKRQCPICGEFFQKTVNFQSFRLHVENHFIGDAEPDSIIDNYELL